MTIPNVAIRVSSVYLGMFNMCKLYHIWNNSQRKRRSGRTIFLLKFLLFS